MKRYTENELILESHSNLHIIENEISKMKYSLEEISDILPGIVHVNSLNDFAILHLNKYGEEKYGLPKEEIIAKGAQFIEEIVDPVNLNWCSKPLIQMIQENDRSKVVSFFQKVRTHNSEEYGWLLTTSKFFKNRDESISISQELSGMEGSIRAVTKVLDDNLYIRKNMHKFGSLTKREKQILKLVAQGMSTKQVAETLFLSAQTVKTHRKNISKKLDFKRCIDWENFADAFDL